ncbi:MAG: GNAT family N-acetyltransferase [Verrucomicrobiae bacterium]|nr:GNAT family N-acetyltransferase [Verrucomicrobiae bacterium]
MNDLVIRPLVDATEARFCAAFMAASDPWLTLGLNVETIFRGLTNPAREVHVAELKHQRVVGALVLHLDGLLNGYIQTIAVHPEAQGHGIGTRLMHFAEERSLRHSPNVFLCVSSFNRRAQTFYERLGYQRVGELPDYVVQGHTEILMRKTWGPLRGFVPEK